MSAYPRPIATVDVVAIALRDRRLCAGLLRREDREEPACGMLALPGSFVRVGEDADLDAVARRILDQKVGVKAAYMEQLGTRGDAGRDPRGWSLSVAYTTILSSDDESRLAFHPVDALPPVAFDHAAIVSAAVERLRSKSVYSVLPLFLLPASFSMIEAQRVYETVIGDTIDAASFRRKLLAQDIVASAGKRQALGAPSTLYRVKRELQILFRRPLVF